MSYQVIWRRSLGSQLAAWYTHARARPADAEAITRAVAEIDRRLRTNPLRQGESRGPFERVLIVGPLSVTFEVHDEEQVVSVLGARYARHRKPPP